MARHEQMSVGELQVDSLISGGDSFRRKIYLDPTNGSDGNDGLAIDRGVKTLDFAVDKLTTARPDAVLLVPGTSSLSLAEDPAWSYNLLSLIGLGAKPAMNKRARIGMSTTFSPFITVSGYGNAFKNIYTMHGTAVGDAVGWLISGIRNEFDSMHFGGPMNAAQGGDAAYIGVHVTGTENTFRNTVFGTDTIGRDEVTPNVQLGPGTLTFFEDCTFLTCLTDGDPVFVNVVNTSGRTSAFFKRCTFMAFSPNHAVAQTVAFAFTGGASSDLVFDDECHLVNVTNWAASASHKYLWLPTYFAATADELNHISKNTATY
jgi:hypothetical protein